MKRLSLLVCALALAITTTAVAATRFAGGTYSGKTAQGLGVTIKVKLKGRCDSAHRAPCVLLTRYFANYKCSNENGATGTASAQRTDLGAAVIRHGKVNAVFASGDPADHIRLAATFKGHHATGAFREFYVKEQPDETTTLCASGRVTFSADKH